MAYLKGWKGALLLSILAPVSLLAAFRMTGLLHGPATITETITLDILTWETERPAAILHIGDELASVYEGEVNLIQTLLVDGYHFSDPVYYGSNTFALALNLTASVTIGHFEGVRIVFEEHSAEAGINFAAEVQGIRKYTNLTLTEVKNWSKIVYMNLTATNQPSSIDFWTVADWVFRTPYNQTHTLDGRTEVVYFNGTVFKEVVQPFQLKVFSDDNNSFENAEELHEGYYPRFYIGARDFGDPRDYYKIYAAEGQRIRITADATPYMAKVVMVPFINLYVYAPDQSLAAATEHEDYKQTVEFTANSTGYWFIEVRIMSNYGFYALGVNQ